MIAIWGYTFVSIGIVSAVSLVGALTLSLHIDRIKRVLFLLVSFAAGAMFGDVFIHLLPEAIEEYGFGLSSSIAVLTGIILLFIVEKFVHWHHCHGPVEQDEHIHPFAITNLIGDGLHNAIDGVAIAASYIVSIPVGIATTIAVVLHEIPQEISDFGVLVHGGFTRGKALFFNFLSGITAFAGGIIALLLSSVSENILSLLVPFSIGSFLYIAGSDLIPEIHKEVAAKRSLMQLTAFVAGIATMALLLFLE